MERLLEEISFSAADAGVADSAVTINRAYVDEQLGELAGDEDLSRFIL
jgi:ATP-dependent HslUV protease ATP-binding subunit HslU